MKLQYDSGDSAVTVDMSDAEISCLKAYAIAVLQKMQAADPEYAECWTACSISFVYLTPEFHWSSIEDADESHPIQVRQPIAEAV